MNRFIRDHHTYAYLKVVIAVLPLIILCILVNNENTDQRVREVARDAAEQQHADDAATLKLAVYTINRNACQGQALIAPLIASNLKLRNSYVQAAQDKTLSASAKRRNAKRIADSNKTIRDLDRVRATYGTIPGDFKCSTLPKLPQNPTK